MVEVSAALEAAREDTEVGVIVLTGEGEKAFCAGGDQSVRGDTGYVAEGESVGRFHVTDLQVQMRRLPKPVVAMVAGYAVGGGQVLHLCCDLTIAADNARFGQTGPRVGSWDGGFGASLLRDLVGTKKAKEFWMLCRLYDADEAREMGLVNTVVPLAELERETVAWCREMLALSPFALRLVKSSFNAHEDGYAGIQQLAHDTNLIFYGSDEAAEGRDSYKEKRQARLLEVSEATVMAVAASGSCRGSRGGAAGGRTAPVLDPLTLLATRSSSRHEGRFGTARKLNPRAKSQSTTPSAQAIVLSLVAPSSAAPPGGGADVGGSRTAAVRPPAAPPDSGDRTPRPEATR